MSKQSILVAGLGKMGTALASGLSSRKEADIVVYDVHASKFAGVKVKKNILILDKEKSPEKFDYVFLCVKPQDLEAAAGFLNSYVGPKTVIISILAGTTIEEIKSAFNGHQGIVRAMPNIAALVHEAATGMASDGHLNEDQMMTVEELFQSVGTCHWTKEDLMDAITGLSGSGPAYIYMVIEALADGGVKMGIPRRMAHELSVQTLLGAAKLVKESGLHPAVLREEVTTPGGTTIHAIQDLEERGLRAMLMSAVEKATLRSKSIRTKR